MRHISILLTLYTTAAARLNSGARILEVGDSIICFNDISLWVANNANTALAENVIRACGGIINATACAKKPYVVSDDICPIVDEEGDRLGTAATLSAGAGTNTTLINCVKEGVTSAFCPPAEVPDWPIILGAILGGITLVAVIILAVHCRQQKPKTTTAGIFNPLPATPAHAPAPPPASSSIEMLERRNPFEDEATEVKAATPLTKKAGVVDDSEALLEGRKPRAARTRRPSL